MKLSFLSHEQVYGGLLPVLEKVGAAAPASDLALLTSNDDGFLTDGPSINYYLTDGVVDRFGRDDACELCAVRPVIVLEEGDEHLLGRKQTDGTVTVVEFGRYPYVVLDESMRAMAAREYARGALAKTGGSITVAGKEHPVYRLGGKEVICMTFEEGGMTGYVRLSDGSVVTEGEDVFVEVRPVRWLYEEDSKLLISCMALFGGLSREAAVDYLEGSFLSELTYMQEEVSPESRGFKVGSHDELSLIRAYVEANIPVFLHGLSGDGKSDRVRQIDPQALDIELVNETPETINGRAVYNETTNTIIDIKPVWLIKLEELCADGKLHILFFDELTNATKQTQSVIFKIVLERFVNNRWPLPSNARIVAAGNDRSESTAAHDLAEPLFGRFAHIYIRTTVENWMPWAIANELNPYVMEFLANNDLYLRTAYTGTEGHADPRRWEMASRVLDYSGNDFSLLAPIVGQETAEAFIRFFKAQRDMETLGEYSDGEIAKFSVARRYQIAQQCLYVANARPDEARALVKRLGNEYLAWYEYMLGRKSAKK